MDLSRHAQRRIIQFLCEEGERPAGNHSLMTNGARYSKRAGATLRTCQVPVIHPTLRTHIRCQSGPNVAVWSPGNAAAYWWIPWQQRGTCASSRHASSGASEGSALQVPKSLEDEKKQLARISAWNIWGSMKERETSFWIELSIGTSPGVCTVIKRLGTWVSSDIHHLPDRRVVVPYLALAMPDPTPEEPFVRSCNSCAGKFLYFPSYSPDLYPCDYHVFGHMIKAHKGQYFATDANRKQPYRGWTATGLLQTSYRRTHETLGCLSQKPWGWITWSSRCAVRTLRVFIKQTLYLEGINFSQLTTPKKTQYKKLCPATPDSVIR